MTIGPRKKHSPQNSIVIPSICSPLKIYPKESQCKIKNLYAQLDTQIYHHAKPLDRWFLGTAADNQMCDKKEIIIINRAKPKINQSPTYLRSTPTFLGGILQNLACLFITIRRSSYHYDNFIELFLKKLLILLTKNISSKLFHSLPKDKRTWERHTNNKQTCRQNKTKTSFQSMLILGTSFVLVIFLLF